MHYRTLLYWFAGIVILSSALPAFSVDYLRLRNGKVIEGAILRQDTAVVVVTDWDSRADVQPQLQVFAHDEIESIWFSKPTLTAKASTPYIPHGSGWEAGGNFSFQTWNESGFQARRFLMQTTLLGCYSVTDKFGFEADIDLSVPFSAKSDSTWSKLNIGTQVSINFVAHPVAWKGMVPFVLVGAGTATSGSIDHLILSSEAEKRNLLDIGLGIKWGSDHLGFRAELRHNFYVWNPDKVVDAYKWEGAELVPYSYRVGEQSSDASVIKIGLFYYN
jgi:hypothetical protein